MSVDTFFVYDSTNICNFYLKSNIRQGDILSFAAAREFYILGIYDLGVWI